MLCRQDVEAELLGERLAGLFGRVGIWMIGAHVYVFRLARLARLLPVLRCPRQHRAQRVRIARTIEEIVGRRLGLSAGTGRIGQCRRIGRRDIWDLVVGDEAGERLGVGGAPAENGRDLVANPFLVLTHARGTW